jgi:hypothetical protein
MEWRVGGEEGLCVSTCWGTQNQGGLSNGGVEAWAIAEWTRVAKWIDLFGSLQPKTEALSEHRTCWIKNPKLKQKSKPIFRSGLIWFSVKNDEP